MDHTPPTPPADRADETAQCPQCGAILSIEGFDRRGLVLCAACHFAFVPRAPDRPRRRSRKAVASLVLGLATPPFCILAGIPAVVVGILALRDISRSDDQLQGNALAVVGITLGVVGSFLCSPVFLALVIPAIQKLQHAVVAAGG